MLMSLAIIERGSLGYNYVLQLYLGVFLYM